MLFIEIYFRLKVLQSCTVNISNEKIFIVFILYNNKNIFIFVFLNQNLFQNMKKTSIFLIIFFFGIIINGFSQTSTTSDFFAGKWEITILGSPMGDIKFSTNLVRKEGKLTGELTRTDDSDAPKRPITKIEESATEIKIFFESQQGGDVSIDLTKVDENNLKGKVAGYDATALRIKE